MTATPGTPLATKLGIREGSTLALLGEPVPPALELPSGVQVRRRTGGRADVVVTFVTEVADMEERMARLGRMVFPAGSLWIAWPKRSSGLVTDVTDHEVRRVALPLGLVDNKVCAIDDTWTGLRLVWRRELRSGGSNEGPSADPPTGPPGGAGPA